MGSLNLPYKYFNYPEYTWANRPTKAQDGAYAVFTDIGVSKELFFWTGSRWAPINGNLLLAQSNNRIDLTGTTTETSLYTLTIKGGFVSANSIIEVITLWGYTNSANTKALRIKLNGASGNTFLDRSETTSAQHQLYTSIRMVNSTASQTGAPSTFSGGFGSSTASTLSASTYDMSADVDLTFMCQLANSGETITLYGYRILYRE